MIFLFSPVSKCDWEGFKRKGRQDREGDAKKGGKRSEARGLSLGKRTESRGDAEARSGEVREGGFGPAGGFQRACLVDRFSILYMVVLFSFFGGRLGWTGVGKSFLGSSFCGGFGVRFWSEAESSAGSR